MLLTPCATLGGVMMNPEDIQKAFSFLDADATGKISLSNLKKRLGVFFPEMTAKDYRFLMNNKKVDFQNVLLVLACNLLTFLCNDRN